MSDAVTSPVTNATISTAEIEIKGVGLEPSCSKKLDMDQDSSLSSPLENQTTRVSELNSSDFSTKDIGKKAEPELAKPGKIPTPNIPSNKDSFSTATPLHYDGPPSTSCQRNPLHSSPQAEMVTAKVKEIHNAKQQDLTSSTDSSFTSEQILSIHRSSNEHIKSLLQSREIAVQTTDENCNVRPAKKKYSFEMLKEIDDLSIYTKRPPLCWLVTKNNFSYRRRPFPAVACNSRSVSLSITPRGMITTSTSRCSRSEPRCQTVKERFNDNTMTSENSFVEPKLPDDQGDEQIASQQKIEQLEAEANDGPIHVTASQLSDQPSQPLLEQPHFHRNTAEVCQQTDDSLESAAPFYHSLDRTDDMTKSLSSMNFEERFQSLKSTRFTKPRLGNAPRNNNGGNVNGTEAAAAYQARMMLHQQMIAQSLHQSIGYMFADFLRKNQGQQLLNQWIRGTLVSVVNSVNEGKNQTQHNLGEQNGVSNDMNGDFESSDGIVLCPRTIRPTVMTSHREVEVQTCEADLFSEPDRSNPLQQIKAYQGPQNPIPENAMHVGEVEGKAS